jgi:hypothetical protein
MMLRTSLRSGAANESRGGAVEERLNTPILFAEFTLRDMEGLREITNNEERTNG